MPIPSYGAPPLSTTFLMVRVMQIVSLIVILGLTANFINEMVMADLVPSQEIVGTISVTSLATLYTIVSIAFYWAVADIGLFVMAGFDFLILIAFIVVSVAVGRPVSYMNCYHPHDMPRQSGNAEQAMSELMSKADLNGLRYWVHLSKSNCFETKAIWGFGIALAILFATSALLLPTLHYKNKKAMAGYKATV